MTKIKIALVNNGCFEECVECSSKAEADGFCWGYSMGAGQCGGEGKAYTLAAAQDFLEEMQEDISSGSTYYSVSDVKEFQLIIEELKSK